MATGKELGEAGMARARSTAERAQPGWVDECMPLVHDFVIDRHAPFAFEDFRAWLMEVRPDLEPPSPNAWGVLSKEAVKREIIRPTGQYRLAASKATHGHPVRLLVRFKH